MVTATGVMVGDVDGDDGFGSTRFVVMFSRQLCSNPHCKRTSPGDGPTCRWHVRNYGSQKDPKHVTLCNACKINFDQGKFCPFCVQIYREKDPDSFDGKEWVGCDNRTCRRWVHVECEVSGGNQVDSTAFYLCPNCRENTQEYAEKKRCSRLPQEQPAVVATCQTYADNSSSELEQKPKVSLSLRSTRRPLQVDLSKLDTSSLKRYRRVYNLREVTGSGKEELVPAVAQHFAAQVVEENETLLSFAFFLKKQQTFATSSMTQHQVAHPVAK
ncbi:uncharacterized protein [Physcomitrium patens]|uniref:uncharacterized protein isoform X2 n=1 Tax=Physcomitrium patens TaxID=3218 RepID=UPI000D169AC8|nr:uncharacterized protein LOC112276980 isoform X2 [Physcomitrium patens]|eukprot:XP_024364617.1 uncharacterized protein LOC112276980 isoform X2 [Physcomitrella patens]